MPKMKVWNIFSVSCLIMGSTYCEAQNTAGPLNELDSQIQVTAAKVSPERLLIFRRDRFQRASRSTGEAFHPSELPSSRRFLPASIRFPGQETASNMETWRDLWILSIWPDRRGYMWQPGHDLPGVREVVLADSEFRTALPYSKDNVVSAVRAYGADGHRSLPVPAAPER
jgi:hypothetical protein